MWYHYSFHDVIGLKNLTARRNVRNYPADYLIYIGFVAETRLELAIFWVWARRGATPPLRDVKFSKNIWRALPRQIIYQPTD